MNLLDKIFKDKNGKLAIIQVPNIFLATWIMSVILQHFVRYGSWHQFLAYLALGAIIIWACLEIALGSSLFRRIVGAIVLAAVIINRV